MAGALCAAAFGIAAAARFFWLIDAKKALLWAALIIAVFGIFLFSGLWEGGSPREAGTLFPAFLLIILATGAGALAARALWRKFASALKKRD